MSQSPRPLHEIQGWMQSVIMHPLGVEQGIESDEARAHMDIAPDNVETVIGRSRALESTERLAIYGNAYYARLLECLGELFPMLRRILGEEVFNEFAFGYLQSYPSRSYTLDRLGADFARYLEETRPDNNVVGSLREPNRDETAGSLREPKLDDHQVLPLPEPNPGEVQRAAASWPELLVDLARLEWTIGEVFDGPGIEGQKVLGGDDLLAIPPDRFHDARLVPVVCLRLLTFRFPLNDYYTRLRRDEEPELPELPEPCDTWLAITRRNFVVRRLPLARVEFEILSSLQSGLPVGEAIARAADSTDLDDDQLAAGLQRWFQRWAGEGLFVRVELA